MTDFFTAAAVPATGSSGSSAVVRAEYAAIEAGFAKLAPYTGNGGKAVFVNAGGTAHEAVTATGTGNAVRATSPTLITPVLGTPTSGTLTNCTGLPIGTGISGLAAGIAAFLAVASSSNLLAAVSDETGTGSLVFANTPVLVTPLLGTPTSGVLTNCTGLPVSTGLSGLAAGIAAFLAVASSANLLAAITDETGTGALVFANAPVLVTPNIGAAIGASLDSGSGSLVLKGAGTTALTITGAAVTVAGALTVTAGFSAIGLSGNGIADIGASNIGLKRIYADYSNPGTIGNVTINKMSGRVNMGNATTTLTLTNSLITVSSHVFVNGQTPMGPCTAKPSAGSCVITSTNPGDGTAATGAIDFFVLSAD